MTTKTDNTVRVTLRMPREVYTLLKEAAETGSHSLNQEIVHRLAASLHATNQDEFKILESRFLRSAAVENLAGQVKVLTRLKELGLQSPPELLEELSNVIEDLTKPYPDNGKNQANSS